MVEKLKQLELSSNSKNISVLGKAIMDASAVNPSLVFLLLSWSFLPLLLFGTCIWHVKYKQLTMTWISKISVFWNNLCLASNSNGTHLYSFFFKIIVLFHRKIISFWHTIVFFWHTYIQMAHTYIFTWDYSWSWMLQELCYIFHLKFLW